MLLFNQQHRSLPKRVQLSNIVSQKHWSCLFKADMQRHPSSSVIIKSIHIPPETNTHTRVSIAQEANIDTATADTTHLCPSRADECASEHITRTYRCLHGNIKPIPTCYPFILFFYLPNKLLYSCCLPIYSSSFHFLEQRVICNDLGDFIFDGAISVLTFGEEERAGCRGGVTEENRGRWSGQTRRRRGERMKDGRVILLPWPACLQLNEQNVFRGLIHSRAVSLCHSGCHVAGTLEETEEEANITGAVKVLSGSFHWLGSAWRPETHRLLSLAVVGDQTGHSSKYWMKEIQRILGSFSRSELRGLIHFH